MPRVFSRADVKPFDEVEWDRRTAEITDDSGKVIFKQENVEVPKTWSILATKVVVAKYFYGENGTGRREQSVRQLIHRVTRTIADWGNRDGYFASDKDAETFYDELTWLCLNQYGVVQFPGVVQLRPVQPVRSRQTQRRRAATISMPPPESVNRAPTQYEYPQCSACFIQSVGDRMEDIMELARSEAMLFKYGSGTGTDLSSLRSAREKIVGRRTSERAVVIPESLRRDRQRGQIRRQDAPRGEDEHAQGLASGHQGFHRRQTEGRTQSLGADRAGLCGGFQWRRVWLGFVPE